VLEALRGAGSAGFQIGELQRATGMTRAVLAKILSNLKTQGKARRLGIGYNTRYQSAEES
jgi:DNA-binding IclR family transcriptional regulator